MDTWIALARGPLFRISLAICLLGLAYRFGSSLWQIYTAYNRAGDKKLPRMAIFKATLQWLLPTRMLRMRPLYGLASMAFHLGIILVPLFFVGHVSLWQSSLPLAWPTLSPAVSDVLSLVAMAGLGAILLSRLLITASRDLTSREDVWILLVLLVLTASGYWAFHPSSSPLNPRGMLLVHMLVGNLALILTPLTKIVHCVLSPLTQLSSEVGWHFPAESGRHVAIALAKENEPI
jgi:nitrate reductase gamma subunit